MTHTRPRATVELTVDLGAVYEVTREDSKARLFRAAPRARAALGDFGEIGDPLPDRPRCMWSGQGPGGRAGAGSRTPGVRWWSA